MGALGALGARGASGALGALVSLMLIAAPRANAEQKMVELTGCVQGFEQGGYFFSDVVNEKGKVKHYLLVNNNEEVKQYEGKMVKVTGSPAPFGWSVKFTTPDKRTLKTSSVFGVDTVEVVQPSCAVASPQSTVASR
jgi:hypothetical protein